MREFLDETNPWARAAMVERLLEAAQRGLWESPEPELLERLRGAYLETDALLEARGEPTDGDTTSEAST